MVVAVAQILGGLIVLTGAAEALVFAASTFARRVGLSPLVIGLTVVSIGTSLPELVVGLDAALTGTGDIALGNVVGSNISNVALIMGVAALARPLTVRAQVVRLDVPILITASIAGLLLMMDGALDRVDGGLLVLGLAAYIGYTFREAQNPPDQVQQTSEAFIATTGSLFIAGGLFLVGLVGLVFGAHILVDGAVSVADSFGVGPMIIGLTIVAVGTSLPELATSVVAARRGSGDLAVGNAVGSSVFNILGIIGVTVLVRPLSTTSLTWVDAGFMVGTAVVILPLFWTHWTLSRREGAFLVCCYGAYLGILMML